MKNNRLYSSLIIGLLTIIMNGCSHILSDDEVDQYIKDSNIKTLVIQKVEDIHVILYNNPKNAIGCDFIWSENGKLQAYKYISDQYFKEAIDKTPVSVFYKSLKGKEIVCVHINDPDLKKSTEIRVDFYDQTIIQQINGQDSMIIGAENKSYDWTSEYKRILLLDSDGKILYEKKPFVKR